MGETRIAALDRSDLDQRIGVVPAWLMSDIECGLRRVPAL